MSLTRSIWFRTTTCPLPLSFPSWIQWLTLFRTFMTRSQKIIGKLISNQPVIVRIVTFVLFMMSGSSISLGRPIWWPKSSRWEQMRREYADSCSSRWLFILESCSSCVQPILWVDWSSRKWNSWQIMGTCQQKHRTGSIRSCLFGPCPDHHWESRSQKTKVHWSMSSTWKSDL